MLPYSIGHEILLLSQRNPLLSARAEFDLLPEDQQRLSIIRAALVCYRTWEQNQNPERNLWLWGRLIRRANFAAEIAEWRNYREAGVTCPPAPTEDAYEMANGGGKTEGGRALGGSYLARALGYACTVYKALGYKTAYDMPLGFTIHLYLTGLEMEGNVRIENEREAQVKQELAEHMAAIEKERKCQP